MTGWADSLRHRTRVSEIVLWGGAGLVMLAVHVGAAAWALHDAPVRMAADSPPPAIMLELAPTPEAVKTEETNIAPDKIVSEEVKTDTFEPVKDPVPEITPEMAEPLDEETPNERGRDSA